MAAAAGADRHEPFQFFLVRGLDDGLDTTRFLGARYFSIATDYVRNGVVELICQEIKQNSVPGAVADIRETLRHC